MLGKDVNDMRFFCEVRLNYTMMLVWNDVGVELVGDAKDASKLREATMFIIYRKNPMSI